MFWERFWNNLQLKILHGTLCCGLRRDWIVSCYCCPWTHFSRWKVSLAPGFVALGSCLATSKTQHIILSSGKVECAAQQARHAWKSTFLPACFAISTLFPPHLPFHWSHLWRWSQEENLGSSTCRARSFYCLCMTSIILNTALTLWMGPTPCETTENQKKQLLSVFLSQGIWRQLEVGWARLVPMWICHCCGLGFCQHQCAGKWSYTLCKSQHNISVVLLSEHIQRYVLHVWFPTSSCFMEEGWSYQSPLRNCFSFSVHCSPAMRKRPAFIFFTSAQEYLKI